MNDLEQVRAACEELMRDGLTAKQSLRNAAIARLALAMTSWNEEWLSGPFKKDIAGCAREIRGER